MKDIKTPSTLYGSEVLNAREKKKRGSVRYEQLEAEFYELDKNNDIRVRVERKEKN